MTLREEAEKSAIGGACEYTGAPSGICAPGEARPDCYGCEVRDANIDAIERVARSFAEECLRYATVRFVAAAATEKGGT